jgi:DNA-binding protein Fis
LLIKAGIYLYARKSKTHNYNTRLFLLFLFALSIQNIAEVAHFFVLANGIVPDREVRIYYVASIAAGALLLHLSIALSWKHPSSKAARSLYGLWYLYAGALVVLVLSGGWLIQGFESIVYTVTRIPGPLFGLLEFFAFSSCGLALLFFLHGTLYQEAPRQRAQNALLLTAVLPMIVIVIAVLALLHIGVKWLNASVILPMGITFFLVVAAYAIHHHRIFDIHFYIPWSKVRRRKTTLHTRIRKLISDIAELSSVEQLVNRLSDALQCPVSLVNCFAPITAGSGAPHMTRISRPALQNIHEVTVAREIATTRPEIHGEMRSHGIAAVVPFNPHSEDLAGWLLLGETFEKNVYSNSDFRVVEELFQKTSDLFLDKFVILRSRLSAANEEIQTLRTENEALESSLKALQKTLVASDETVPLEKNKDVAENIVHAARASNTSLPLSITLLGRDKNLARRLRDHFRDVKTYVGLSSKAFQRAGQPQALICSMDEEQPGLAAVLSEWKASTAVVLYGGQAREFANQHDDTLSCGLIDIIDNNVSPATLVQRFRVLSHLHKQCYLLRNCDVPLIGGSSAFNSYMRRLQFLSRFSEPAVIYCENDIQQFIESVHYLHNHGDHKGQVIVVNPKDLENLSLDPNNNVTVACPYIDPTSEESERLIQLIHNHKNNSTRFIIGYPDKNLDSLPSELGKVFRGFSVIMPKLAERMSDIPLLVHYFALQFNLHSPVRVSCDDDDLKAITGSEALLTIDMLRCATFEHLSTKGQETTQRETSQVVAALDVTANDRSLDDMVSEFESQIIQQTLRRCGGNKSKAARLLGLRPNTLHYKLERYRIGDKVRRRRHPPKIDTEDLESEA